MNILFPIAESAPIYKIGGLGDVGRALPIALNQLGHDVRIIMPLHPEIKITDLSSVLNCQFTIVYNQESLEVTIFLTMLPGSKTPVYLVKENKYLSEHTGASDNHADKFAVFSSAVAEFIAHNSPYWEPHIVHCHDWHSALIPVILKHQYALKIPSVITIHNLAYQGVTQTPVLKHLDLSPEKCQILSWDLGDGDLNILLEGILHANRITTVSPTYAKEILTQEYGEKIDQILNSKKTKIIGILNGIDTDSFNPESDPMINFRYSSNNWQEGKKHNREEIRGFFNLTNDENISLISFIGRVDPYQKGIGIIIQAIRENYFDPKKTQLIFLGTGDPSLENQLHEAAKDKSNIRIVTRFDEPLARKLYAASHFSIIPSRFEPCGLVQLISQRYGTIPIVRKTGGLNDTVFEGTNGFLFDGYNTQEMIIAINRALNTINTEVYSRIVNNSMTQDFSWIQSAKKYDMLYQELINE